METLTIKTQFVYHILDDKLYTFDNLDEIILSLLFIKHQPK